MQTRARTGGSERRRRIWVSSGPRAELIAALAKAIGLDVVRESEPIDALGPELDLRVVEADKPEDLPSSSSDPCPLMVVATRRLREAEASVLRRSGARWVLDGEASVLDASFALSELLFHTIAEQRRYWRSLGGTPVRYQRLDVEGEELIPADLVGLAREAGFLRAKRKPEEGTAIEIALSLPNVEARLRARVAFVADDGFAIEFALDDQNVAPRLSDLLAGHSRRASWRPSWRPSFGPTSSGAKSTRPRKREPELEA
jgi:hypothetical protein